MILFLDTEFTGLGQRWPRLMDYFTSAKPEHHALHDAWAPRHTWQQAKALEAFQAFSARMEPIELWP